MPPVISVENLSKSYRLGVIGTGTFSNDLKVWWARTRGKPNPLLKIGQEDHGNRAGEEIWALKDVSFQVDQGEVLGIIGRNGAGKSTLLKILSRVTAPTSGSVKVKGRIASLLEVGTGFHPELTGRENIYLNGAILGMTKAEVNRRFDEIVEFAEIAKFIDTPVKRYSSGMYVRLAFAVAAHLESEILLVDEVLAVGDAEFQKKCLGKMGDVASKEGRTVLFVSHNMAAVENLCERGLLFKNGNLVLNSKVKEVVSEYLSHISFNKELTSINEHILYWDPDSTKELGINSIEILDIDGNPKKQVFTWDDFIIGIKYYSKTLIKNASLVVKISDHFGKSLVLMSTRPDSNIPMAINQGTGYGQCIIRKIPFTAGEYILGCGLAVPNKEWLWWEENLAVLIINAKDIFVSGLAPTNKRALLAVDHEWKIEK